MEDDTKFETTDIRQPKTGRRRFGMNWKAMLTAFVIVAIGAMLLITEDGRKFAGQAFELVSSGVGESVSGFFSHAFTASPEAMPDGEQFIISTEIDKSSFYGQEYRVSNSSFEADGLCDFGITISGLSVRTDSRECEIEMDDMIGDFKYTEAGTVRFDGTAGAMSINGNIYTANSMQISMEMLPSSFMMDSLVQSKMEIESATGSINRITQKGSLKSTEGLDGERLLIGGFVGFISLEESNINLQGAAVSVEGIGAHSSFSW